MENKVYVLALVKDVPEEEYRNYVSPLKTRRYGKLLKRALITALKCLKDSGISHPDAIINGTALGSIEETENILDGLVEEGEDVSMPTQFMLCTHNSVASLIGIYTGNHGYNATYSQGRVSFESALLDAFVQLKLGRIKTALVTVNDAITPLLRMKMEEAGMVVDETLDRSMAILLSTEKGEKPLHELVDVRIFHERGRGDVAEIETIAPCD